ncbi:MAG TPA: Flp pilus assembly protein CpaB [Acidimicrobiales bacterium]|nr:Flp pilus assembly protein CpaB [Acidimicrobiales bacterium]
MILIAAIAVGALAAFMIFNYVGGVEDKANEGAERVDVFVVRKDIPKGLPGEQARDEGYIVQDKIPREFLPASAIQSLDQIDGRVALNNLAANQVLVDGMFVDPAQAQIGFSARIPESQVAVTVSIDEVRGVAGLLVPGDKVDLLVASNLEADDERVGVPTYAQSRIVYHSVEILAIGQTATPQPGENITAAGTEGETTDTTAAAAAGNSGLITFLVPLEAAQLITALDPGQIYLTLVGPDYEPEPLPSLTIDPDTSPFPGETGGELTPYGPDGAPE